MKFENYRVRSQSFDETFSAQGQPHKCCATFAERLENLTDDELTRRQESAEFLLRDLGITFTVYGHESGTEKIWPFDLLPRIVDGNEWVTIQKGLKQRIEALNLFVDDIYNDQRIIKDGVVPEELLKTSKTYREQMKGFHAPQGAWCHISGVDLIRGGDGQFYVLEDNLRCPSGVSYVLENREVLKRTLANMFDGMNIEPIHDYPERLLDTLLSCAPDNVEDPTAVLLTPGIYNSAYFEHTFLAQKMGIKLVQGSDLTIRNNRVYMCTTRGLEQVDVIYRRIDDDFLDPKYFNPDSVLGVKGLMDVYRAGNVTLANAPGTGVADDKAVYTFVPQIIKYYLDQDAILSNVPTYLCSDAKQRQHVLANPQNFVIKPVNESGGYGIVMGPQASKAELAEVSELVKDNPRNYIAQPMLQLSTVPTLVNGELQPRHVDLRPFVLCGKEIYVMPGGLTRVALQEGSMIVNSSQGGGSKDTWVLKTDEHQNSEAATNSVSPPKFVDSAATENLEQKMLSRVAESVYWMSRYVERAENVARFVDVNYNLTLGESSGLAEQWLPLIYTTGDHEDFQERYGNASRENALKFLLFDSENPNSILSCISNARECARTVREVLPSSIWEQLNRFRMLVLEASKSGEAYKQPFDFCESVRTASQLLAGIANSSMLHDEAWSFKQMGRFIERADKTSRIVDVQYFLLLPKAEDVGSSIDIVRWSSLLKSADALDMYRRIHGRIVPEKVAQFLILDPIFPRSIRFCANKVQDCLMTMRGWDSHGDELPSEKLSKQLTSRLNTVKIEEIIEQGMHAFIDQFQGAINSLGNTVYSDFFNTEKQTQRFAGQRQVMGDMVQQQS